MQPIYIFEVEILKFGTLEVFKTIRLMAFDLFQASHICYHLFHDEDSEFGNEALEMGTVKKMGTTRIYNPEFFLEMLDDEDDGENSQGEFDGSQPIEVGKRLPDEAVMKFKCSCHEELRVPKGFFPFVICPNCENKILRREVRDIGGIFIYEKLGDNKK